MAYAANVHVAVYQVLDEVIGASAAPPGARGEIHSIIDDLRHASSSSELIALAECISLRLLQLETALGRGDREAEREARQELKGIAAAWLDLRILN